MIQPEIKNILCHNLEYGKEHPDSEDGSVFIEVEIGPEGQEGADFFSRGLGSDQANMLK